MEEGLAGAARLVEETDNILAAARWTVERGREESSETDISQFWYVGRFDQLPTHYLQSLAPLQTPNPSLDQGIALHEHGVTAYQRGEYMVAEKALTKSLALSQATADPLYAARANTYLGLIKVDLGEYPAAETILQQSLADLRRFGEHRYSGYALAGLACVAHQSGQPLNENIHLLQKSLAISREIEDKKAIAHTLLNLGRALNLAGEANRLEAQKILAEAIPLCRQLDEPWPLAMALTQAGLTAAMHSDQPETASRHFHDALNTAIVAQATPLMLQILLGLAKLWMATPSETGISSQDLLTIILANVSHCPYEIQAEATTLFASFAAPSTSATPDLHEVVNILINQA